MNDRCPHEAKMVIGKPFCAKDILSEPPAIAGGLSDALNIADNELNSNVQPPATAGGSDLDYTAVTARLKHQI